MNDDPASARTRPNRWARSAEDEARERALEELGIPTEARGAFTTWIRLFREWEERLELDARNDEELYDLLLADAVVLAGPRMDDDAVGAERPSTAERTVTRPLLLPRDARVVDVGPFAGAPGLALAILRPDLQITLVEPLAKRLSFLRAVITALGRHDIGLVRDRAEDLVTKRPGAWDVAVARTSLPPAWVPIGLRLAGAAWALAARDESPEVLGARLGFDVTYAWPLTGASRRASYYERA